MAKRTFMLTQWIEGVYCGELTIDTDEFESEEDRAEFEKDPEGYVEELADQFDIDWDLDIKNSDSIFARETTKE